MGVGDGFFTVGVGDGFFTVGVGEGFFIVEAFAASLRVPGIREPSNRRKIRREN